MKARFRSHYLPLLAGIAAKGDARHCLAGIRIEPASPALGGGVLLIATDGLILCVVHDPYGRADEAGIIPIKKSILSQAKKPKHGKRYKADNRFVVIDGDWLYIVDQLRGQNTRTAGVSIKLIEGKYPDVSRVIPALSDAKPMESLTFNPIFMSRVHKAISFCGVRFGYEGVKIFGTGEDKLFFLIPALPDDKMFFVIMPMRADNFNTDWIDKTKSQAEFLARFNDDAVLKLFVWLSGWFGL